MKTVWDDMKGVISRFVQDQQVSIESLHVFYVCMLFFSVAAVSILLLRHFAFISKWQMREQTVREKGMK